MIRFGPARVHAAILSVVAWGVALACSPEASLEERALVEERASGSHGDPDPPPPALTPDPARASSMARPRPGMVRPQPGTAVGSTRGSPATVPASWVSYPSVAPPLREAVTHRADADVVLRALVDGLAPYRWDRLQDWDNLGYVRIGQDAPHGWVTQAGGTLRSQPPGEAQLGCAGGYLEGVRALLVPQLRMDDLQRCDDATWNTLGSVQACHDDNFGLRAIANTAAQAQADGVLSGPARHVHIEPSEADDLAPLLARGPVHLCTVSHASTARDGILMYHHLMILARARGARALLMFDTTGYRGVSMRRMTVPTLVSYVRSALANNDTYRYDPASTHLDCVAVTRQR